MSVHLVHALFVLTIREKQDQHENKVTLNDKCSHLSFSVTLFSYWTRKATTAM